MKWLFIIVGIIICIILIVLIIGYSLPVKHTASVQFSVDASPEKVWQRLTDFKEYPQWRHNLKSVDTKSDLEWAEVNKNNDSLPFKIIAKEPFQKLVTQINGKNLPFGGSWEFTLHPEGNKTVVVVTEHGEVYNPIFRFVSKFIMGQTTSLNQFAGYLAQSFK